MVGGLMGAGLGPTAGAGTAGHGPFQCEACGRRHNVQRDATGLRDQRSLCRKCGAAQRKVEFGEDLERLMGEQGMNLVEAGAALGVSKERVRQRLASMPHLMRLSAKARKQGRDLGRLEQFQNAVESGRSRREALAGVGGSAKRMQRIVEQLAPGSAEAVSLMLAGKGEPVKVAGSIRETAPSWPEDVDDGVAKIFHACGAMVPKAVRADFERHLEKMVMEALGSGLNMPGVAELFGLAGTRLGRYAKRYGFAERAYRLSRENQREGRSWAAILAVRRGDAEMAALAERFRLVYRTRRPWESREFKEAFARIARESGADAATAEAMAMREGQPWWAVAIGLRRLQGPGVEG